MITVAAKFARFPQQFAGPIFTLALTIVAVFPVVLSAQEAVSDGGRAEPAPWRPSFGPINQNAADEPVANRPVTGGLFENARQQPALPPLPNSARQESPSPGDVSPLVGGPGSKDRFDASGNGQRGPAPSVTQPGTTRITSTFDTLPNNAGQIWREYDITPYTGGNVSNTDPQQSIVDWILKETGTNMWFTQPLGMLSADRNRVMVYHTPEIQRVVKSIIDRFNRTRGQAQIFDISLVTIRKPDWRSQAYSMMQPIEVSSPGVEAWLMSKENAALLLGQLERRADFKRHSGGRITSPDGQAFTIEKRTPKPFVRAVKWTPEIAPGYQPQMTTINEGYSLSVGCLTTLNNESVEAMVRCEVDQVEKLTPVKVNVPGVRAGSIDQIDLNIPQLASWRLHERFRWPADQVLLLGCGVVASPESEPGASSLPRLPLLGRSELRRADALLFLEYRGPESGATLPRTAGSTDLTPVTRPR